MGYRGFALPDIEQTRGIRLLVERVNGRHIDHCQSPKHQRAMSGCQVSSLRRQTPLA